MSSVVAARVHALGGTETAHTVLSGVGLAIFVNALACLGAGVLVAVFLRRADAEPAGEPAAEPASA